MPSNNELKTAIYAVGLLVVLAGIGYSFFSRTENVSGCDSSYPDVCIPPAPPDLNCRDIKHRRFRVVGPDPHNFDRDKDGIGCES